MTRYAPSYFRALNHLIEYGAGERAQVGRDLIAQALRDLRRTRSREQVRRERDHMFYVCPFPLKGGECR